MAFKPYKIVGHRLCPYVQRVVIVMIEKGIDFERIDIDLDNKPAWLGDISPGLQVPVFWAGRDEWLFESGVIARYLDQVTGGALMPSDLWARASHEAWMAYADGMLNIVARIIYRDVDASAFAISLRELEERLRIVNDRFQPNKYFAGNAFGLVDTVFATLFRYFSVLDRVSETKLSDALPQKLAEWWALVGRHKSVKDAVPPTYEAELIAFIARKESHAARVLARIIG
jgi:glutathione S-transferase